jgi:hypothetical protein
VFDHPLLRRFDPRLELLPDDQRILWARLAELPEDVVLYGGTAISVRLAHRVSVDFDLFLPRHFRPDELRRENPLLRSGEVVQVAPDTVTVRIDGVRVSLFGVELGVLGWPDVASDNGLPVASLRDLAATKLNALLGRAESRDYVDIAALLDAGVDLADALGGAEALFGASFSAMLGLKALTSFEDGDLPTLPDAVKDRLRRAVRAIDRVPVVGMRGTRVLPVDTP